MSKRRGQHATGTSRRTVSPGAGAAGRADGRPATSAATAAPTSLPDRPSPAWSAKRLLAVLGLAIGVQAAIWGVMWYVLWVVKRPYGFFDVSDIAIYLDYAKMMAGGGVPYVTLPLEYPPLAVPLFRLPALIAGTTDPLAYYKQFALDMMIASTAAGALTAVAATRLWRDRRPYAVAIAYGLLVLALGAITANRYDAVVACVFAASLLLLGAKRWKYAGLVLGIGFALKLTPVILLPLVLVLAARRREIVWSGVLFAVAAAAPFLFYAVKGTDAVKGLWHIFSYHLHRPLQLESVLGTPFWIGHLLGWVWVEIGTAYGSQFIAASGSDAVAKASGYLMVVALAFTYWLIWRRRETLRAAPRQVPLAVLALVLTFLVFGKVLSPQYFIWTLPAIALVIVERKVLGGLLVGVLLLTQVEFPTLYWRFVALENGPVAVVVVRNLLLAAAFILSLYELWKLPDHPPGVRAAARV